MQRLVDAVAHLRPHMPEVGALAQFKHELVLGVQRVARIYGGKHLGQAQKTVGQAGRHPGVCAVQRIAGAGIVIGLQRRQSRVDCLEGGFKVGRGGVRSLGR